MALIKALLAGLVGVSLCMAGISGVVTDTGTTPIAGATVKLEKSGETAITGIDGSFSISPAAILPGNGTMAPTGLSAGIFGDRLTVTIAERSAVEVATFDLTGKTLSTMRQSMAAGSHSIPLPCRGAGIYLYVVKSGDRELTIKGNSVGGKIFGSPINSQGPSTNFLTKQAKVTFTINDVIAITKAGYLNHRAVVTNSDTSGIIIKMVESAGTLTDIDGNVYQTVKIGNQVWMAENLRARKFSNGSAITLDMSPATWSDTIPKYCYYNNSLSSDTIRKYGALYNWYVVNPANSSKIAPTGWHVPTDAEWDTLQTYLIIHGYNWDASTSGNKIAKSLAAKTDWFEYTTTGIIGCDLSLNNRSGFSALPAGVRGYKGSFDNQGDVTIWWSATENDQANAWICSLYSSGDDLGRSYDDMSSGYSVRLVKD